MTPAIHYLTGDATAPTGEPPQVIVHVCNDLGRWGLVGQHGLEASKGVPPVRYDAIQKGLAAVAKFVAEHSATVHMPRIGCGLSGGTWDRIEPLIESELVAKGIDAYVYDLPD